MPEDAQNQQAQGVDEAKLASLINTGVKSALSEMQAQTQQQVAQFNQQRQAQAQQQALNNQWAADPVAQTIAPYVAPVVQQLGLQVQAANDKADFYLSHPEAMEYKGDVESMFNQLLTQGRPMEREAVWYYYKGRNADVFAEKDAARKQQALSNAVQNGASVDGAAVSNIPQGLENYRQLPPDKLKEAIGTMTF